MATSLPVQNQAAKSCQVRPTAMTLAHVLLLLTHACRRHQTSER